MRIQVIALVEAEAALKSEQDTQGKLKRTKNHLYSPLRLVVNNLSENEETED